MNAYSIGVSIRIKNERLEASQEQLINMFDFIDKEQYPVAILIGGHEHSYFVGSLSNSAKYRMTIEFISVAPGKSEIVVDITAHRALIPTHMIQRDPEGYILAVARGL